MRIVIDIPGHLSGILAARCVQAVAGQVHEGWPRGKVRLGDVDLTVAWEIQEENS